jgi:hypothetical protein
MDSQLSPTAAPQLTSEQRNWAMAAHLSALIAVAGLPFGHIVGPLIVYLVKGGESEFVGGHARTSLNYQITISIAAILAIVVGVVLFAVFIGFAGITSHNDDTMSGAAAGSIIALWIGLFAIIGTAFALSLVFIIMGTIAAGEGRPYTYPFAIKFIR